MGWLRLVGSLKLCVSFAKEPYKRDYILQKRHLILRNLLIAATPYMYIFVLSSEIKHTCSLRESFVFLRLSRPPKGWQNRQTEKAKGYKILQEREILAGVKLNTCT